MSPAYVQPLEHVEESFAELGRNERLLVVGLELLVTLAVQIASANSKEKASALLYGIARALALRTREGQYRFRRKECGVGIPFISRKKQVSISSLSHAETYTPYSTQPHTSGGVAW